MALIPFPVQNGLSAKAADGAVSSEPLTSGFNLEAEDRELIELVHEQTRCHRRAGRHRTRIIGNFLWDPKTILRSTRLREPKSYDVVLQLPEPVLPTVDFCDVLAARASSKRNDVTASLNLQQLGTLLHIAVRANRTVKAAPVPEASYHFRPYPSPGALYPGEIYVLPNKVDGLAVRPYVYDARRHLLIESGAATGTFANVETAEGQDVPACVFCVATVLSRATAKYGVRGYRLTLMEAGHIAQNLTLTAQAMHLPSLVYGSFYDGELEAMLGLDGLDEIILSTVLLGGAI